MIIETIFSTLDDAGRPNFAPMGLVWGEETVLVRPFRDTQTYRNLRSGRCGVASLSDDVLAYVQCGLFNEVLPGFPAAAIDGVEGNRGDGELMGWLKVKAWWRKTTPTGRPG